MSASADAVARLLCVLRMLPPPYAMHTVECHMSVKTGPIGVVLREGTFYDLLDRLGHPSPIPRGESPPLPSRCLTRRTPLWSGTMLEVFLPRWASTALNSIQLR